MSRGRAEADRADAPWGPRWNFAPRALGNHRRILSRGENWSPKSHCFLLFEGPLALGPSSLGPRALTLSPTHRGSGLRRVAHPQQHPFTDAATAIFRLPPGHGARVAHAVLPGNVVQAVGWPHPTPAPTSSRAGGLWSSPRLLRAALKFPAFEPRAFWEV